MQIFTLRNNTITNICKKITLHELKHIESVLNLNTRTEYIIRILESTNSITKAHQIDLGVLEATIVYIKTNNYPIDKQTLFFIYDEKMHDIIENLKKSEYLRQHINSIDQCQRIAFYSPQELNPDNWKHEIAKKRDLESKKSKEITTDAFLCFKCGQRRCKVSQIQKASADEGMSTYIQCINCYNIFSR